MVFRKYLVATLAVVGVLILLLLLYHARLIILVFIIAGIFGYVLAFPVGWLSRWLPRGLAVGIMLIASGCLLAGFVLLLIPMITEQSVQLYERLPTIIDGLEQYARGLKINLPGEREVDVYQYVQEVGKAVEDRAPENWSNLISITQSFVSGTLTVVLGLLIIPMVMAYMLLDGGKIRRAMIALLPDKLQERANRTFDAIGASLGRYIFSRSMLALFVGMANTIMLTILGVPYAILLGGVFGFIGEFVPYVGPWLTAIPAGLIILADEPLKLIPLAVFLAVVQLLENYVIGPKLFGDTMDLHPLSVIFAMFVGASLGGFVGLFLAIPVAAALKSIYIIFIMRQPAKGVEVPELEPVTDPPSGSRPRPGEQAAPADDERGGE